MAPRPTHPADRGAPTARRRPTKAPEPLVVERADGVRHLGEQHAQAFLGLVRAGETIARRLDSELQDAHGISLRGFEVLLHLAAFSPDRRLRVSQLVAQAPLSQSRVSRLVAELESRGLVRRSTAERDSRGVEVALTDAGLDTFRRASDTHLAGLERHLFSRLTWRETRQLGAITAKLLADPPE